MKVFYSGDLMLSAQAELEVREQERGCSQLQMSKDDQATITISRVVG